MGVLTSPIISFNIKNYACYLMSPDNLQTTQETIENGKKIKEKCENTLCKLPLYVLTAYFGFHNSVRLFGYWYDTFFFFFSEVACRPFGLRLRRVVSECGLTDCACVCEWADCDFSRMGSDWGPWAAIGDWATIGDPFSDWLPWAAIGERGNPRASEKVC